MGTIHDVFRKDFIPYVVKWGRATNLLGCLLLFSPCLLLLALSVVPPWEAVLTGVILRVSMSGVYFIIEPISYFTTLGVPGTYMAFLAGDISSMRVPCAIVAQEAGDAKLGSPQGTILATIGVAVSIVVNVVILTVVVIGGTVLIAALPKGVTKMFDFLLPALYASLLATALLNNRKLARIAIPLGALMTFGNKLGMLKFLPSGLRTPVVMLTSVFGSIALGLLLLTGKKGDDDLQEEPELEM